MSIDLRQGKHHAGSASGRAGRPTSIHPNLLRMALLGFCAGFLLVLGQAGAHAQQAGTATTMSQADAGTVRGLLKPTAKSDISVQISAPVESIPRREGQPFKRRDVLLRFDCGLLDAEWRAANAAWKARRLKARSKQRLLSYQAAGRLDAAIAAAEAEQAAAEARRARLKVQQCKVRAPFDGWVVERHVDIAETPQPGAKLLTIVKRGPLEVEMIVPASWLGWLKPSEPFIFRVDGLNTDLRGQVMRIGAVVDEVSQTVRVYGVVDTPPPQVKPGMSGQARFLGARAQARRNEKNGKPGGGA